VASASRQSTHGSVVQRWGLVESSTDKSRVARRHLRRIGLGCTALALCAAARADDSPTVTPYRPSVSTPAVLSAPGWLEIEAGVQNSRGDDPVRRASLPYTLKLAFTPDWGIRIGGDAFVRQVGADGSALRGGGDTTVVLKHRFAVSEASAFGLELGTKLPTARVGLGSGHSDVGVNGIYSSDFAENWHTDINVVATHIGDVGGEVGRWQESWAAAFSRNLTEQWGIVGEVSGTQQSGNARTAQALVAASYAFSRAVTLDIGVSRGLTTASGGWSVFSGITFLAAHLF
jgi:hypothetical protein